MYGEWMGGVFGGTAAGPIWKDAMSTFHRGLPVARFGTPSTVRQSIVMPSVVNLTPSAAAASLKKAGFTEVVIAAKASDKGQAGLVASQSPAAGSKISRGQTKAEVVLGAGSDTNITVR